MLLDASNVAGRETLAFAGSKPILLSVAAISLNVSVSSSRSIRLTTSASVTPISQALSGFGSVMVLPAPPRKRR